MKVKLCLALALLGLGSAACVSFDTMDSEDLNQDAIYQQLKVTYDSDTDTTTATATFRAGGPGGTTLELTEPSSVKIDGETLSSREFLGTSYSTSIRNPESFSHTWVFKDRNNKEFANSIELRALTLINVPTTLDFSADFETQFEAPMMQSNEEFQAEFSYNLKSGGIGWAYRNVIVNEDKLRIQSADLASLNRDNEITTLSVQFVRIYKKDLDQATPEGGEISAQYKTESVELSF